MTILEFFSLLGGVGLFLFGMTIMSSGLKNACGDNLQVILSKATTNKVSAVLVGIATTVLIQSSAATDVMVIGFVNAEMMTLGQAIAVIMGANIGTTVTAQITAFNIAAYAPFILFIGAVMYLFIKKSIVKHVGEVILGFGMLFVGISYMKLAIAPLSKSPDFTNLLQAIENPFLMILFGIAFTALLQSSSSSTVIFQTFAIQGLISYNAAVYLVIGAAIGSVTPNLLASLTTNRNGKRTAVLNLIFNIFRAVILLILITVLPQILDLIQSMSPDDIGRQIANTHTIFAIIAVVIMLPFTGVLIKIVEKLIPILPEESEQLEDRKLQYMVNIHEMPPAMALSQSHLEITRMGRIAAKNLRRSVECFFDYTPDKAESVRKRERSVDILNNTILSELGKLKAMDLSSEQMMQVSMMSVSIRDMERLSDHAENIVEYVEELTNKKAEMSDTAIAELKKMAECTLEEVDMALDIFEKSDFSRLDELEALEDVVDDLETQLVNDHIERFMAEHCDPRAGVVFTDIVTDLERCADNAINIAYAMKGPKPKSTDND
ncbi:MAG: Na/Pi cotransporter family protein [Firmicutes bacterium]|nr:Na/Pi cotransporter family protein [Bacillota bacterium]